MIIKIIMITIIIIKKFMITQIYQYNIKNISVNSNNWRSGGFQRGFVAGKASERF